MPGAILDIDELRRFIHSFGTICGNLREQKDHMNSKFRDLNEVWRDSRYDKFEQSFKETVDEINQFLRYAEMYADYLQRKAQKAQAYVDGY